MSSLAEFLDSRDDSSIPSEDDATRVIEIVARNSEELSVLRSMLPKSVYLRGLATLLVGGLTQLLRRTDVYIDLIEEVLDYLPICCRPGELHAMCLDAWINLWSEPCPCTTGMTSNICRASVARSVVADMIVKIIARTEKGNLYQNRENYLLTIAGQMLSKFFIPETANHRHSLDGRWAEAAVGVANALLALNSDDPTDPYNQVRCEAALRMVAAVIEFQIVRVADWWHACEISDDTAETLIAVLKPLQSSALMLNIFSSKIVNIDPSGPSIDASMRSADFELCDADYALVVLTDWLTQPEDPIPIPMIWTEDRKLDVVLNSALCLMNTEAHVLPGLKLASSALPSGPPFRSNQHTSKLVQRMIELATGYGDESTIGIQRRRNFALEVTEVINFLDVPEATNVCLEVISRSRSDTVIGIFVKILQSVWLRGTGSLAPFYSACGAVLSDDYQIMDGLESLKSLLNWARLVYLRTDLVRDDAKDKVFERQLTKLASQVDIELKMLGSATDELAELKRTRVLFVGHLIARVKEIISGQHDTSCPHHHQ